MPRRAHYGLDRQGCEIRQGSPISVEVVEDGVLLRVDGRSRLTLEQKLKAFDPKLHGGESMVSGRTGAEVF